MNCCKKGLVFLLFILVGPSCYKSEKTIEYQVVHLIKPSFISIVAGASERVYLHFVIEPGYHLTADSATDPVQLELTLEADSCVRLLEVINRSPIRNYSLVKENPTPVYQDTLTFELTLQRATFCSSDDRLLRGQLIYRACTDRGCLFPRTLFFELPLQEGELRIG